VTEKIRSNKSTPKKPTEQQTVSLQVEKMETIVEERLEKQKDQFLENLPRQPKKEIAEMLESCGILVPRRFKNLVDALEAVRQGGKIIVRSEHPQEYAVVAGLLTSYDLTVERMEKGRQYCEGKGHEINWNNYFRYHSIGNVRDDAENKIFGSLETTGPTDFEENLKKLSFPHVHRYCELLGIDVDKFYEDISYSYWEKIVGLNRSIVADSAVPERYHIFTTDGQYFHNYLIIDSGQIVLDQPSPVTDELRARIDEVVAFYEKIRNAEGFNPKHCPLVEFQTVGDQNYFLQYHRTRDMEPCTWKLKRGLEEGELEAAFVRGATPPEGMIFDVTMYYPKGGCVIKKTEDGSFDFHFKRIFSEIMSRRRRANFDNKSLWELTFSSCIAAHLPKSKLFNPGIFISISDDNLPPDLPEKIFRQTEETQKTVTVKIRVVSDGRKAYIKFLK